MNEGARLKAIILAAGRGSRMKDKTEALPKCLMSLHGKTLLEWQLQSLRRAGISEIAIVDGYRAEEIETRQPQLKYFRNDAWAQTQMVATILKAVDWLCADDCVVSYSDIVYSPKAVKLLLESTADIAITYHTKFAELWRDRFDNPLDDIETFKLDAQSNLIEIGQRAQSLNDIEGQYMGLLKFTPRGWDEVVRALQSPKLPKPIEKIDMTGLLSFLLSIGISIKALAYDELFLEVDNPDDLSLYESWAAEKFEVLTR